MNLLCELATTPVSLAQDSTPSTFNSIASQWHGTQTFTTERLRVHCAAQPGASIGLSSFIEPHTNSACFVFGYTLDLKSSATAYSGNSVPVAEFVLQEFRTHGPDRAFNHNGVYAILLYDSTRDKCYCAIDKYGMFPIYYTASSKRILLGNSLRDLMTSVAFDLDYDGIEEYLELGFPLNDRTFFRNIHRLGPATFLTWTADGSTESHRYWWFDQVIYEGMEGPNYVSECADIFRQTISDCLALTDSPVCFLSSGYDSRWIALEMLNQSVVPRTYTVEMLHEGYPRPTSLEERVVNALLPHETFHTSVTFPKLAELSLLIERRENDLGLQADEHEWVYPLLDAIPYASGINHCGIAGDVLFGAPLGWPPEAYEDIDSILSRLDRGHFRAYLSGTFKTQLSSPLRERLAHHLKEYPLNPNRLLLYFLLGRTRRVVSLFATPLVSSKLESFYPFLDDRLVCHALKANPIWKEQSSVRKLILDRAYPRYSNVPSSRDASENIPKSYIKDMGFLFYSDPKKDKHYRELLRLEAINHAIEQARYSFGNCGLFSSRATLLISIAKAIHRAGVLPKYSPAASYHMWAIPKLCKVARLYSLAH